MIYSGNLNDYRDAIDRLTEDCDVTVKQETLVYEDPVKLRRVHAEILRVFTRSGQPVTVRTFEHNDRDVRINAQAAWLRKVHSDLQHWK